MVVNGSDSLTCMYNRLPEDEPFDSKHVEDIKIQNQNIILKNVHFVGLYCIIVSLLLLMFRFYVGGILRAIYVSEAFIGLRGISYMDRLELQKCYTYFICLFFLYYQTLCMEHLRNFKSFFRFPKVGATVFHSANGAGGFWGPSRHLFPLVNRLGHESLHSFPSCFDIKGMRRDRRKVHPCTGTEALYRPYGP